MNDFVGRVSSIVSLVLRRAGIFFLLAFALLAQSAWGQRIGPLVPDDPQRSKASSAERKEAVRPPSLQLSLPSPAAVALPPLGPNDLQRLQPQEGRPPLIGVHRRLPAGAVTRSFSGGAVKTTAEGAWQSTAVGRLWRLKMTSPSARAMRIHFRDFAIGAGSLWLYSASGQVVGPYTGSGLYGDGDFWSGILFGDSLTIEYMPDGASAKEAVPFQIVEISHIWDDAFGGGVEGGARWPQGALGSSDRRGSVKPLPDRIDVAAGTQLKKPRLTKATKAIQLVERSASLQQPRPKAARPLTPGRPVSFSRGPVDTTTVFSGDDSFRLEVPDNASRVTFTLESDADVALLVRYGENIAREDGRIVFDYYADKFFAGTEEIVITPQSDPPLRAGTYYVAVGLFATGVVVNCTLTAEVEREGGTPPPTSGNTLTPGQPVSFQRGPVDNLTLFFGPNSFRLEVPEDASRVTFTLESDADVLLAVRYGEDNAGEDGGLVTDYRSRNPAGNERILITPRSDPPLRAGTYFVSVVVIATGVVVNCTLTAEVELEGETRPTISGGTLTPGQPADFRLGPADSPAIFAGDHSFRLEAPENASRITFTLESVDPDVDLALLVRYGEDNDIQDGRPVFDHGSQNPEGNERIVITRRSDPPLRAGTYFVSVFVIDTGVVAEGTLTATVETDVADCHLDATCYPEWSSSATGVARIFFETGASSSFCSGTLLNNSREDSTPYFLTAAHCVQTEEEARSVTAFWLYQTQTCNGDLPDLQSVPKTEGASLLSTTGFREVGDPEGDMTLLRLEGDLPDGVMFQGWDASPQPFGKQVTGIHHPGSDDWGFFKRISFGQIIPDPVFGTSADVYAIVSYTQGYTEGGSSGSALFSSPGTVVGALSFGEGAPDNACRIGSPLLDSYTHFSVIYPHIVQFVDPPSVPGKPQAPTVSAATPYSLTVEWTEPENTGTAITDYDVQYREVSSGGFTDARHEGTALRATLTGLSPGTVYEVQVRASNATGTGAWSESGEGRTSPQQTGGQIYYFPHLAVGASWQTTITYINFSSQEVTCRTDFLSDQGSPLMVSFGDRGTVVSRTDVLLPGGSVHQETNVALSAPLAPGWARATCSGPVQASLLYRQHNSEGMPTAEAGVNATAVPATRFVTFAEQGEGKHGTGVAYANPSDTAALVTFTARDADGEVLAIEDLMLPPNGHDAQNMPTLFDLSSFTGSLEVTSTEPVVSLSLNFEADPVFSSLPPGELDASAQGSTTYYFPHLAVGASWQTTITYINYSREEVTCRTDFLSDDGTPLMVSFEDRGTVVSRTDVLPPGGSVHQETNVDLSAPLAPGWARATCSGPVQASLLYRQHNSEGMPTAEAGVNATAVPATRFVTFAEQGEGKHGTGVAYANPSDTAALVTFTARDADGEVLAIEDLMLPPNGHDAQNMPTLFDLSSFTGSLEVTSTEPIVSLSLNFEAEPVFSSLPPGELDAAPDIPGEMLAPADEAAFNDLFVGKRVATNFPEVYADFVSPGRFRETQLGFTYTGSYTFQNTGSNTGTLTFNYDDYGDRCTTHLTFASAMAGTATFTCNYGSSGAYDWRLVEIPASAGVPDLVIQTPSVSDSSPNAGGSFTLSATVRNQGNGRSASTTLRYYRSSDETISTSDTAVGTDAVGGLAASGTSAESISLTAPSTAGTYYYGACVDPVFGEFQNNNCSTAVRVTVSQMEVVGTRYEVDDVITTVPDPLPDTFPGGQLLPPVGGLGAQFARQGTNWRFSSGRGGYFEIGDYRYTCDYALCGVVNRVVTFGTIVETSIQSESAGFDLDNKNGSPEGIAFANNRFYVVDSRDDKVYAYQATGQRDAASDFALDSANWDATGITFANNRFYVVDWVDDKVYAYQASGQRDAASDFALDSDNFYATGITFVNNRFYVVDILDDKVYAHHASGERDSASDFDLDPSNDAPGGITFANNRFYVVDWVDGKVYAYQASGQRDSASDFDLDPDNDRGGGITFANDRFFVVDWADYKVYAYSAGAGPGTTDSQPSFGSATASDQSYQAGTAISPLTLPAATGGDGTLTYSLAPSVPGLSFNPATRQLTGTPTTAGTYNMTYTVRDADGDTSTLTFTVAITQMTTVDLVVASVTASDDTLEFGQSFDLRATVRNAGTGASTATSLRYYRSTDATITMGDMHVATDDVSALAAAGTSSSVLPLTAPWTAGTYYYGACVDPVSGESNSQNNCSTAVRVTVSQMEVVGTRYEVGDVITTLPTGIWFPDRLSGSVGFRFVDGKADIRFGNGGLIEENGYRYMCENAGGCHVNDREVKAGTIVETSTENNN